MLSNEDLLKIIAQGESISVEFKSDRNGFNDSCVYEEIVAFANTEGGILLIGVEDNGSLTGARPRHETTTDPLKLQAAIFNNTVPHINTRISVISHGEKSIIAIEVEPYPENCATSQGKALHRTIKSDGKPQTVPFYPHEQRSRKIDLGLLDFSAQPLCDLDFSAFDPLEFVRLRQTISRLRGDQALLDLSDEELAKALKIIETNNGKMIPNIAGLLLLAKEEILENYLPTHTVHFQVLDAQGNVKVNDTFRCPLLRTLHEIESRFSSRNEEKEVTVGLFRLPVPDYSPEGFREAVNNAILHRDYSRKQDLYIQWQHDHMLITNPGGFLPGINIDNILVHEPKPRNPRLAEAFKRIGLVEQTGRGVDKIYLGQLRYGRPIPDYSRSDSDGVKIVLRGGPPSLEFAVLVYEQSEQGRMLTLDELMVLNSLFYERRIDTTRAGRLIQKGPSETRSILENLVERGLMEAKGERRGRIFHLASSLYKRMGKPEGYVRTHNIDKVRQEGLVIEFIQRYGRITRGQLIDLLGVTPGQARRLIDKMKASGKLVQEGTPPRWSYYVINGEIL